MDELLFSSSFRRLFSYTYQRHVQSTLGTIYPAQHVGGGVGGRRKPLDAVCVRSHLKTHPEALADGTPIQICEHPNEQLFWHFHQEASSLRIRDLVGCLRSWHPRGRSRLSVWTGCE